MIPAILPFMGQIATTLYDFKLLTRAISVALRKFA
jgi:hypothetical protein